MTKGELNKARDWVCGEIEALLPTEQIYCSSLCLRFTDPVKYLDEGGNISHPGGSSCNMLRPGHYTQLPLDDLIDLWEFLSSRKIPDTNM